MHPKVYKFSSSSSGSSISPAPPQSLFQSTSSISLCIPATKVSNGHNPSSSSGQPDIPVRGTTASLSMIRICCVEQERTWICRLVAKGQILFAHERGVSSGRMKWMTHLEETNERFLGIRSSGGGPDSANVVRFRAGSTGFIS